MKIIIFDEEELYITGLKNLLLQIDDKYEIDSCYNYNNIKTIMANDYDIIFITKTNKTDIFSILSFLNKKEIQSKIIILTSEYISSDIKNFIKYNVSGYISNKYSNEKIISIIKLILLNETYFPNDLIINSFNKIVTKKQIDIIKLINKGLSNKQIAYELNISESTVKVHITNILKRMKCYNRVQLLNKAKELGINLD